MAKLIQEEEVRYYADFIDEIYHDDGTVSEFKRVACDITKWFDPSKVIPGKMIGIRYEQASSYFRHDCAWLTYDTKGNDKVDIIRTYGGVITKIKKVTNVIIRKEHEEVIFKNDLEVNASPHSIKD